MDLFMKPSISDLFHPFFKTINIKNTLGLNKLYTRSYFFCQADNPCIKWISKWVCRSPDKKTRRNGQLISSEKLSLVPHVFNGLN